MNRSIGSPGRRLQFTWREACAATVVAIIAASSGYHIGAHNPGAQRPNPSHSIEYYLHQRSFSEIENTKALLSALANRLLTEIRTEPVAPWPDGSGEWTTVRRTDTDGMIRELRDAMAEFRGSNEEFLLAHNLLTLLRKNSRDAEWLEVYLDILYRNPTHPLIGHLAPVAHSVAGRMNRLDEIHAALRHVSEIPYDFEGKSRIVAILAEDEVLHVSAPGEKAAVL
jgi:hypothetical protein